MDIEEFARELEGKGFTVRRIDLPGFTRYEISIYQNTRQEILVKADTLGAYISRFRATMFQREAAPSPGETWSCGRGSWRYTRGTGRPQPLGCTATSPPTRLLKKRTRRPRAS